MTEFTCPGSNRREFVKKSSLAALGAASVPLWRPRSLRAGPLMRTVFQVDETRGVQPDGAFGGLDDLIALMGGHGLRFYRSPTLRPTSGPDGLFSSDDVIMLKVNSQWKDRGMTNVDLLRGLVKRILDHPDGFTGEVVFVENTQWRTLPDCFGWQSLTNSEDRSQTYRDIIDDYSASGHRVSGYDWRTANYVPGGLSVVTTPDDHTTDEYYHDPTGESEHYARFTTLYGTRINFKHGIWTGSGYDNARLKFINLPILKDHGGPSVTACLKNYMGVIAPNKDDSWGINYHRNFPTLVGRMIGTTRFPDLNIVDATWVIRVGGPSGLESNAVEARTLLAGTDPVAVDYHAGKHVLFPLTSDNRHHPDLGGKFQTYLTSAMTDLRALGYDAIPLLNDSAYNVVKGLVSNVTNWLIY